MRAIHVIRIETCREVICDFCSADYTASNETGGMLFQSKGVCPKCLPRFEESVKRYGEEEYIRSRAREGETFREFIHRVRIGEY